MLCIATAGAVTALAATSFTLGWTHSVEHTRWEETWRVAGERLELVSASVEGSGAGIALPDGASWHEGKWVYRPALAPLAELNLAASGATGGGWSLCAEGQCRTVGNMPGADVRLWVAPDGACDHAQEPAPR